MAVAVAVGLFVPFHRHGFDDPYITYRYAWNLAHGHGFVYNPGARVLSTTTPLYTLLLTLFAWSGGLPQISIAISCLSFGAGAIGLWRIGHYARMPLAGAAAAVTYPLFPLLVSTVGAETGLYTALIIWGIVHYIEGRYVSSAVLLAFGALTRADGVVPAAVLLVHFIMFRRSRWPWRAISIYLVLLGLWFVWAWWYFGSPLPVTLMTKQFQGRLSASRLFLPGLLGQFRAYGQVQSFRVYGMLAIVGTVYGVVRRSVFLLVVGWCLLYTVAYTLLGVTAYFWYYAPLVAGVVSLVGLGAEVVRRLVPQRLRTIQVLLGLAVLAALVVGPVESLAIMAQHPDSRLAPYAAVGRWLHDNTPTEATVGTLEVGIIGYYSQRPMVDFAGLIQPDVARQLTPRTTYDDAAIWAVGAYHPAYLVVRRGSLPRLIQDISPVCSLIRSWTGSGDAPTMDVYRCTP